jgi:outer membrane biosynthesis protein TonB
MRVQRWAVAGVILVSGCKVSVSTGQPEPRPTATAEAPPPANEPATQISEPATPEPTPEPEPTPAPEPTPIAKGSLDRDVIRRVVLAHLHEVRNCYNVGLAKDPQLQGRVALDFVIGGDGKIASSVAFESTLKDPMVAECIVEASKGWVFPEPEGGGNVIVRYPFNLIPG